MITLDKKIIYLVLFFFHIALSWTFNSIAHSDFLANLHNGEGFWFFAVDSIKYHNEALIQLEYLKNSDWVTWFNSYTNHSNVKVISLSYWISGNPNPISVSIVNAIVWLVSIVLIFRSSQLIFPKNFFLPFLISTFFFHPSILMQSTQLLRDPYLLLGICCFIYGWVILERNYSRWRWLFYILLGFILTISMRSYLFPMFAIPTLIYMTWVVYHKRWMFVPFAVLVILLAIYQSSYVNKRTDINVTEKVQSFKNMEIKTQALNLKVIKLKKLINDMHDKAFLDNQIKFVEDLAFENINNTEKAIDFLDKIELLLKKKLETNISQELIINNTNDQPGINNNFKADIIREFDKLFSLDQNSLSNSSEEPYFMKKFPPVVYSSNPVVYSLNALSHHIGAFRYDWVGVVLDGGNVGSAIDANVQIIDFYSALKYLPRAAQIGFLAPFPKDFLASGNSVGRIGYILSGVEMLLWYFILFGFFYSLFVNVSIFRQLIPVFIFSFTIIILLAYVVPVVGALFRMRQGYMIPFYIYGIYGLQLIYNRFSMRQFHSKH